jgi:2-succinyl-6-hydroxy-2,4-cyclohexadiene-1-carboxylate synthase
VGVEAGGQDVRVPETIILLHGFTQTSASWDGVVAELGERYRALAPDLRGHGQASELRPVSFDAIAEDVAHLAPERFVLAGYSMGGRVGVRFALEHPERVSRLVLLGATAGIEDPVLRAERRAGDLALANSIEKEGLEVFARRWAAQPLFAGQADDAAAAAHADRLGNTASGLAAALRGVGTGAMEPLWSRLAELTMPVVVLAGERDGKFRTVGERLAAAVPHGDFGVIPGAGHAAHLEAPASVAGWL